MLRRKRLALEVNVRSQVDSLADRPAQGDSDDAAENAHSPGLGKKEPLHVAVAGSNRLHDSDLAAALENSHHQRVHNSDESDSQRKAAEDSEKHIQHLEELLYAPAGVEDRKGIEAHFLDRFFDGLNLAGAFHSHAH